MLAETETEAETCLDVPCSDAVYPQELVETWRKSAEIAKLKLATGEIKPKTVREFAAERGIKLD